jgi:very-short-patch-repair endonuclease
MLSLVPRQPFVPEQLTHRPFTVAEAGSAGLSRWHLEGASWRRLEPGVYAWAGLAENPVLRLRAARLRTPERAVFAGKTAAWLHGLDVPPCEPIDMILRRDELHESAVVVRRGFRTTSPVETLFDISRRLSLVEAVVVADMALHAGLVSHTKMSEWIDSCRGRKGVAAARRVLELASRAAQSPMETRLRMLLVLRGLPHPEVQVTIRDHDGSFVGRPDLYYPDHRLGLEYDGETHRVSLVADNRRQNRLLMVGIRLLRFTSSDVMRLPQSVVAQVRDLLVKG